MTTTTHHPDPDTLAAAAEQEATEAGELVDALEERVRDGDDTITAEELASARELGTFARLRAEAARRKAARAKAAARLAQCQQLRTEIETAAAGTGEHLAELLHTVETAVTAFVNAVQTRNAQIRTWRQRMHALGVPEHRNPLIPPADHGHLGHDSTSTEVIAGRRRLRPHDPDRSLALVLRRIVDTSQREHRHGRGPLLRLDLDKATHWLDAYAELTKLDTLTDEPTGLRFFRGPNGAIITLDREPTETERRDLTEITQQEAWGQ